MSGTNQPQSFLYDLYNTGEAISALQGGNGAEKLAQADVLDQILAHRGLSPDDMKPDELLKVANEIFGPNNDLQKLANENCPPGAPMGEKKEEKKEEEKEAQAKLAEADHLGRVMAHAYVNELATITKEAAEKQALALPAHAGKGGSKILNAIKNHGKAAAGGTAAVAMAGGAAKHLHDKHKEKKEHEKNAGAEEIEALAQQQAIELLKQAGYNPETLQPYTDEEKLAAAVNQRTIELLQENGFTIE